MRTIPTTPMRCKNGSNAPATSYHQGRNWRFALDNLPLPDSSAVLPIGIADGGADSYAAGTGEILKLPRFKSDWSKPKLAFMPVMKR
jgi:hypothetical protein